MQAIRDAILSGDRSQETFSEPRDPRDLPGRHRPQGRGGHVRGTRDQGQGPAQVAPHRRRAGARARAGRGARGRDGERHQLQHRVDLDLRAGCRRSGSSSATAARRSMPSATTCPTTWSAPTSPASSCAPARACPSGSPGQEVVAHCLSVELEDADGHNDTMLDPQQRIWGFETNFGGLAELAIVKANQLMPKPDHLTWEEAASPGW